MHLNMYGGFWLDQARSFSMRAGSVWKVSGWNASLMNWSVRYGCSHASTCATNEPFTILKIVHSGVNDTALFERGACSSSWTPQAEPRPWRVGAHK